MVEDNENQLLVSKNSVKGISWPLGPTGKLFLALGNEKVGPSYLKLSR
jgi:hypothetical protein